MTDIERVYSDADMTRTILAGVDHASLPRDYLTSEMARERMSEIERLRADNARLRAALTDIYDAFEELSNADVDQSVKELARGVIERANR